MKISNFKSSSEFKKFTHTLASNSKGKLKAGQIQNTFAATYNFPTPKALFNHLDGIHNKPFTLGISLSANTIAINFWGDFQQPDELTKLLYLDNERDIKTLSGFLFQHSDFSYANFIKDIKPTLASFLKIFDINSLKLVNDKILVGDMLNTLMDGRRYTFQLFMDILM